MPKGYWIPHLDVSNPEGFQAYRSKADAWHQTNGSRLLARAGRHELVEGKMRARNVLREFDSYDHALAAYRSPEYSAARPLRAPPRAMPHPRMPDRQTGSYRYPVTRRSPACSSSPARTATTIGPPILWTKSTSKA